MQRQQRRQSQKSCPGGQGWHEGTRGILAAKQLDSSRSLVNNLSWPLHQGYETWPRTDSKRFSAVSRRLLSASNPQKTRCFPWRDHAPWIMIPLGLLSSSPQLVLSPCRIQGHFTTQKVGELKRHESVAIHSFGIPLMHVMASYGNFRGLILLCMDFHLPWKPELFLFAFLVNKKLKLTFSLSYIRSSIEYLTFLYSPVSRSYPLNNLHPLEP